MGCRERTRGLHLCGGASQHCARLEPVWVGSLVSTLLKNKKMHPSPMHFRGWAIGFLMRSITDPHPARLGCLWEAPTLSHKVPPLGVGGGHMGNLSSSHLPVTSAVQRLVAWNQQDLATVESLTTRDTESRFQQNTLPPYKESERSPSE